MFPTPSWKKMTCDIASEKCKTGIRSNLCPVDGQNPGPFGMNENILNCPKRTIFQSIFCLQIEVSFTIQSKSKLWQNLKWDEKGRESDIINDNNGRTGYILEVDFEYPEELHDLHIDFPFAPEFMEVESNMLSEKQVEIYKLKTWKEISWYWTYRMKISM